MPSDRPRWAMPTRPVHEVGQLRDQAGELVDHEHQPRDGRQVGAAALDGRVVLEVLGARPGEQVLASAQLGAQRHQRPADQVVVEVGDHADGVRQPGAVLERGAALVVHEHEGQLRPGGWRPPARPPGSAGTPTCRSRWCRRPGACGPSLRRSRWKGPSYPTPTTDVGGPAVLPAHRHGLRGRRVEVDLLQQPGRPGDARGLVLRGGVAQRGDARARRSRTRAPRPGRGRSRRCRRRRSRRSGRCRRSQATTARHSSGSWRTSRSTQTTCTPTAGPRRSRSTTAGSARSRRAPSSTTSTSGVGRTRSVAGLLPGLDHRAELGQPPAHRLLLGAEQRVHVALGAGVRQPPDPVPVRLAGGVAEHHDPDVARRVQQRGLGHQPARQRPGGVLVAGDADHPELGEVHPGRHVVEGARRCRLVGLVAALLHAHGGRQRGQPDPQPQVVGVAGPALPEPRAGADRRHQ